MSRYVIGADIGGTTVKIGVFNTDGDLLDKWEIPTDTSDKGEHILGDIADSCKAYMRDHGLDLCSFDGIGMGVPGMVNADGTVKACVNIGWGYKDANKEMKEALGIPAFTDNDANAAALGEMWQGGAKGVPNMVMVTLGTGVGGGVIVNGKTVRGSNGNGGEIGHITIRPEETLACNCGRKGCLEQYCSANGIARTAKEELKGYQGDSALKDLEDITSKDVFEAAKAGDAFSISRLESFGKDLGFALSNLAVVTDPQVFVIGGGVSKAGKIVTDYAGKYFRQYALEGQKGIEFRLAALGNDAGIYGCALSVISNKD